MKRNYLFTLLFLLVAVFMPNNAHALRYAGVKVYSEPSSGGFVWVTKTENNLPSTWEKTYDSTDDSNASISNYTFYFYRYCSVNPGYVFKGWATSSTANSSTDTEAKVGVATTSANNTSGKRKVDTYYAIFARLAVDNNNATSQSYDFGEVKRSVESRPTHTFAINHAHAGKVTASLSNSTHFSIDKTSVVANSTTEGTAYIVVTYNPPCDDDGEHSTVLTITNDNGLDNIKVTITAKSVKDSQSLSWVEPINTNILKGTTAKIEATATSGLVVSYSSNKPDVLTVDANGNITAVGEGDAIITASQAGDCTYDAATKITKTFTVSDKKTPTFWLENDPDLTEKNLMVDGNTTINITNIDAEDFNAYYDANLLGFSLVDGVATITAKNAGTATLTLTQTETNAVFATSRVFTFHISKYTGTLALTNNLGIAYKVDDAVNIVDCYTASNSEVEVQVASSNTDVIAVVDGKLKAVGAGTATITFSQAETYKWTALSVSQTITVTKYDLSASISQATATWDETINNPFAISYDLNGYTVKALDPAIATYTNGAIQTYAETGTARFVISRAEDYKYNQLAETLSISVAPAQESCVLFTDNAEHTANYEYVLPDAGAELTIQIKHTWSAINGNVYLKGYTNEGTEVETILSLSTNNDLSSDYKTFTRKISPLTRKIQFTQDGGTYSRYAKNLSVTRAPYFSPSETNKTIESTIGTNATGTIQVQYSSCGGTVKVVSDNPKITVSPASFNAEGSGTQEITLTGDATVLGTETATITIYDQSKKTAINVTSTINRIPQTISWQSSFESLNVFSRVTLDATASGLTEVVYSIAEGEQEKASIVGNVLSFNEAGIVHVVATAAQSDIYESVSDTVSVEVRLAQPVVSQWPTATLTYGKTLTDVVLRGESKIEGTFQWGESVTEEDLAAVKTAETYTHEVKFVPVNSELYNTVYGLATITIQEAAQEIIWENYPTLCNIGDQITLEAKASSGLPVEYFIDQNGKYATIDPETNILTALAQGTITLEVSQQGEVGKYLAANVKYITISILPKQPTNTESLNADMSPVSKVIRNGVLYILRGGMCYDINGRLIGAE